MSTEMAMAIKQLVQEKGVSEELVRRTIEESLLAAYKKKFGIDENAVVRFSEDGTEVTIFAQKRIVEEVMDPVTEIALEQALAYNEESEIGDELLIEINPKEFDRISVQSAKQRAKQTLREIQKDTLYSEFKEKVGEMIIGYYQRERNGTIFVDLGKTEGILPRKYQSPREVYHVNDRIRALIYEVNKTPSGLQILLSRTHTDFVKRIFELEVPEIYDGTVGVFKIVREPGYRTKIAVYSTRDDVDPVGACVGLKGVRIQAIVRELEGEKIDILKYDPDARTFIKNALSPADVLHVVLLDEAKKHALAVVGENQFSLAIGRQGLNVRLANRIVDWNIDVRTEEQFEEMDITAETKRAVSALFGEIVDEEISKISELPGISAHIVKVLGENGYELLEDAVTLQYENLIAFEGMSDEEAKNLLKIIEENVQIVEEEEAEPAEDEEAEYPSEAEESASAAEGEEAEEIAAEEDEEEPQYECPECGATITLDMTACPSCGVGLSFEDAEEDVEEEDSGEEEPREEESKKEEPKKEEPKKKESKKKESPEEERPQTASETQVDEEDV